MSPLLKKFCVNKKLFDFKLMEDGCLLLVKPDAWCESEHVYVQQVHSQYLVLTG